MTQNSNPKPDSLPRDASASESVEASLEDFISQANASFPAADGWDLHTGDVELIEADDGPALVAPRSSSKRVPDRTEVVSQPLPAPTYAPTYASPPQAAGTNPLLVAGLTVVAVAVGAVLAFYFLRSMAPQQQPAPQAVVAPAPAAAPVAVAPVAAAAPTAPVVTPIPAPAAPVVTPIPAVTAPVAAQPEVVVTTHHDAPAPKKHSASAAPKAAAPKAAAAKAAAPKSDAPKKDAGKKSSDWVDPFAN